MSNEIKILSKPLSITDKEAFVDASRDELRALIAIIEASGRVSDAQELAKSASISKARAAAAIVYWEEAGVLRSEDTPTITEEFEKSLSVGELAEKKSTEVAKTIRNSALAEMISECAKIMQRAALNTTEIKQLTELYEQYSLSEEYILTLAAYLAGERKLTVTTLINRAIKYATEYEIDDLASLSAFIEERESTSAAEKEFRRIFGFSGRALSKTEKEYFKKWSRDFGYFVDIVGEAYDIAVMNGAKKIVAYVDNLLTGWYSAGCKTLIECKEKHARDIEEKKEQREKEKTSNKKSKKPLDNYSDFDPDEAFRLALERSFGSDD